MVLFQHLKMGGGNLIVVTLSKDIFRYLITHKIQIQVSFDSKC